MREKEKQRKERRKEKRIRKRKVKVKGKLNELLNKKRYQSTGGIECCIFPLVFNLEVENHDNSWFLHW